MAETLPRRFGPYVLLKVLGSGSAGKVYFARAAEKSAHLPSALVIKTLHQELAELDELVARFRHEAELAVVVSSPHVARVFDAGMVGKTLYICLEFVPGCRLSQVLYELQKRKARLSLQETVRIFVGAVRGLEALHSATDESGQSLGIIHRDISPKNLMVDAHGKMKLIDLGLGKSKMQGWKTQTGTVMGSPGYMAPEQVLGKKVTASADVYALGVVLWEMLTATPYIPRGALNDMLMAGASPRYVPLSQHRKIVPPQLEDFCQRALQPKIEDRFSSAREMRRRLEELLAVLPAREPNTIALSAVAAVEQDMGQLKQLLSIQPKTRELGPDKEETVVFATRSELEDLRDGGTDATELYDWGDVSMGATEVAESPLLDSTTIDEPIAVAQPGPRRSSPRRRRDSEEPPNPTGTWAGDTEPMRGGSQSKVRSYARRGVPLIVVAALVSIGVGVGLIAGRMTSSTPSVPASSKAPRAIEAQAGTPTPEAPETKDPADTKTKTTTATEVASSNAAPAPATSRPPRAEGRRNRPGREITGRNKRPARRTNADRSPRPNRPDRKPEPAESASITQVVQRLSMRVRKLKSAHPDRSPDLDLILSDIQLEAASGDQDRARQRLRKLSKKLDAIAAQ